MKPGIHPEMFADAKITCSTCGAIFRIPATVKEISVETCRMCHPVYTGKKQGEARGGRVERFRKRMAAGKTVTEKTEVVKTKATAAKTKAAVKAKKK
ncbi:MAG: 50S ribosomal protein L31 [Candidatus Peregrinibacteria bacterium]